MNTVEAPFLLVVEDAFPLNQDADLVLLPDDQGGAELRTGGSLDFSIHSEWP